MAFEGAYAQPGAVAFQSAGEAALAEAKRTSKFDSMPPAHADSVDNSIITESLPTEATDFAESRQLDDEVGRGALPLIGNRSIGDQQRILVVLVGLGLLGLIALTIVSIASAGRGAAQVAASGQALMQSQRLAKSVSQALVGSAQAFPEMRESAEVLARNVRSLKTGEGGIAAAPDSVQSVLESGAAAGRSRREERQHGARAADGADAGRPVAAHDQPPVGRPARDRRDGVVAEGAARCVAGRARRPSASW